MNIDMEDLKMLLIIGAVLGIVAGVVVFISLKIWYLPPPPCGSYIKLDYDRGLVRMECYAKVDK